MTDTTKTEGQPPEEEELIPVETPPEEPTPPQQEPEDRSDGDPDEDHDDGDGDERLGEADETDEEKRERRRSENKRRRDAQRRAREAKDRHIELLTQRLAALEGTTVRTTLMTIDERIAKAAKDAEDAERIEVAASAAGNTDDVLLARRVRDAAVKEANTLFAERQRLAQTIEQPQAPQGGQGGSVQANPHRDAWLDANKWFDPSGADRFSAVTKAIDIEIAREGFDPNTREYWQELTRRAGAEIDKLEGRSTPAEPKDGRRKGPPTGGGREHAPPTTRGREIYVTPERKQAMIDAGVWDDPVARSRYLKAYQEYDNAAR